MNGYQGQILPEIKNNKIFKAGEDLFYRIKKQTAYPIDYIESLGVQAPEGTNIVINQNLFTIGKTGILQFNNTQITSITFSDDTTNQVKIDYIVHKK